MCFIYIYNTPHTPLLYLVVLEQCVCHRLKGDDIVCEWFAFSASKDQLPLTLENLDQFEHEVSTMPL